ncbi:MAG: hypothetical protein K2N56_11930, partial [Oscillospiraceae bacterium]|nr:hypothetical protein [Oscillospiraceae bacterium]
MKKLLLPVILSAILLSFPACGTVEEPPFSDNTVKTGFDMDRIRKNIIVKGEHFEIPVKLNELADGLTYELWDEDPFEGRTAADIFRNGDELCTVGVMNCYAGAEGESEIYYISLNDSECSADGIVPLITTKQEVLDKYGEPGYKAEDEVSCIFYYSEKKNITPLDGLSGKTAAITFENDKVSVVS